MDPLAQLELLDLKATVVNQGHKEQEVNREQLVLLAQADQQVHRDHKVFQDQQGKEAIRVLLDQLDQLVYQVLLAQEDKQVNVVTQATKDLKVHKEKEDLLVHPAQPESVVQLDLKEWLVKKEGKVLQALLDHLGNQGKLVKQEQLELRALVDLLAVRDNVARVVHVEKQEQRESKAAKVPEVHLDHPVLLVKEDRLAQQDQPDQVAQEDSLVNKVKQDNRVTKDSKELRDSKDPQDKLVNEDKTENVVN